jgi:hypothetical protein
MCFLWRCRMSVALTVHINDMMHVCAPVVPPPRTREVNGIPNQSEAARSRLKASLWKL